jgi:hypothetical protein
MRKLTGVVVAIAVAVTLAIPAGASAKLNHRHPKHGCKNDVLNHDGGPGCKGRKARGRNLSHRFQDGPFRNED